MKTPEKNCPAGIRQLKIEPDSTGQRLDNYLFSQLKGVPKSHLYRSLRTGQIRVNKGRKSPDYRLKSGDIVRIPPMRTAARALRQGGVAPAWLGKCIIYEDDHLLAVAKPAGLAVHGGSGVSLGLIEGLRRLRSGERFLELVHRLDRETSGCLLVARRRPVLKALHEQLREGRVRKRYVALVMGAWTGKARRIEAPLEKNRLQSGERMVRVAAEGKASSSRFIPKRAYLAGAASATLVDIELLTGRTHQARVHAAHLGRPIAGDPKYGDLEFNRQMRAYGLKRMFLHAGAISFIHPVTGSKMRIAAPLPPELSLVLDQLEHETDI